MDFQSIKAMSQKDALSWADQYAGVAPGTMDGLWRTETGRGSHPTLIGPPTKWGTAKGHFQALDSTHAEIEKRIGTKLDRFDFYDSLIGAAALMKENRQREGNDDDAVRSYHGGPNRKQWGPKTEDYVLKVRGGAVSAPAAKRTVKTVDEDGEPSVVPPKADDVWNVRGKDVAAALADGSDPKATGRSIVSPAPGANVLQEGAVAASQQALETEQGKVKAQSFLGLYDRDTTLGAAYSKTMSPTFRTIEAMFGDSNHGEDREFMNDLGKNWDKYLKGYTDDERSILMESVSQEDYNNRVHRIATSREDSLVLGRASTLGTGGAMLLAGAMDPTTWATGIGAAKAFAIAGRGATALAAQGRSGAALASLTGENILGNVSYELVQQAMGEQKSVADYALSAGMSVLPVALGARGVLKAADAALAARISREAIEKQQVFTEQAVRNLGENAEPAAVAREAERLEAESLRQERTARTSPANGNDRMDAPNLDDPSTFPETKPSEVGSSDSRMDMPVQENWADPAFQQRRADAMATDPNWQSSARIVLDNELDFNTVNSLGAGVRYTAAAVKGIPEHIRTALDGLAKEYLPGAKVAVGTGNISQGADGIAISIKDTHLIGITPKPGAPNAMLHTGLHELGHAVVHHNAPTIPADIWARVDQEFASFTADLAAGKMDDAIAKRFASTSPNRLIDKLQPTKYALSRDEYLAEQFVKHIQERAAKAELNLPAKVLDTIKNAVKAVMDFVLGAARKGYVAPGEASAELFRSILRGTADRQVATEQFLAPELQIGSFAKQVDPIDTKYGLDMMQAHSPRERMEKKYIRELFRKAEDWVKANPADPERLKTIANNGLLNFATPGTLLANSSHPVAQMIAGTLMEHTMGASGRRATASIKKVQLEREYIGNAINRYEDSYTLYRNGKLGRVKGFLDDLGGQNIRRQFDREVFLYKEAILRGEKPQVDPNVASAGEALTTSFGRMLNDQKQAKTAGWGRLPENSDGYVPHVLDATKVANAGNAQLRAYTNALTEQLMAIENMDAAFARKVAQGYLDHARINAAGGHEIPANVYDPNASEYVRQTLKGMGLGEDEIVEFANRLSAGAARHTKQRLHLDLGQTFTAEDGSTFQLVDLFKQDHISLLRGQARRVSGEVALAGHGVAGAAGLRLIERALQFGEAKLEPRDIKAFQQFSAEMLGTPYGGETPMWLDNALAANATANLGGMGFTQIAEYINVATGLGIKNTLEAVSMGPKMLAEVRALARGEKVENGILSSMELPGGGGEFGLENYKMVTAYDSPSSVYDSYGRESAGVGTRIIRASGYALRALSLQRVIHAVQSRGVASQITSKALRYIRDGNNSKALADMGFTPEIAARVKADMSNAVQWNGDRVLSFDITKFQDVGAAEAFAQAVRRGTAQLIQDSFPGEKGYWQHNAMGKMLTQFRTFPILATEKQWGRNRANHGAIVAAGMLIAGAGAAMPIYLARLSLNAAGRPDRDEYLEKMTSPMALARATLNYVGMAGMMPDLVDALSYAGTPIMEDLGVIQQAGSRTMGTKSPISSIIPLAGYANEVLNIPKQLDNPHNMLQPLPFSNTPWLIPIMNGLRPD